MAKAKGTGVASHTPIVKLSKQGGKIKTSTMNKQEKKSFKRYRGQGR
jgi:hypothetical protein